MYKTLILALSFALLVGCSKKEDAPGPQIPHVAGEWNGTGTDDTKGFYYIGVTLAQSGNTASGSYTTSSSYTTTHGTIYLVLGPVGGNNLQQLTLTESTGKVMTLTAPASISNTYFAFFYTGGGGANLSKIAGTN